MHSIAQLLLKYSAWLKKVLIPLGPWGVLLIAVLDSVGVGIPIDPVVATFVFLKPQLFWLYIFIASAGSALGCMVLYAIGYKGGEALLMKRMSASRFDRIKKSFEDHEFLALMFPAMLPPPTPYKLIVLSAAAFEMDWHKFLFAIFLGRIGRFTILSILVMVFGPEIVSLISTLAREHLAATLAGLGILLLLGAMIWKLRSRRQNSAAEATLET